MPVVGRGEPLRVTESVLVTDMVGDARRVVAAGEGERVKVTELVRLTVTEEVLLTMPVVGRGEPLRVTERVIVTDMVGDARRVVAAGEGERVKVTDLVRLSVTVVEVVAVLETTCRRRGRASTFSAHVSSSIRRAPFTWEV